MNSARLVTRAIARNVVPRRNYGKGDFRTPVMNDLPTPQGDFFALQAARNRGHNTVLAIGIAMFTTTLIIVKESGLIHMNYSPPDTYE